MRQRNMSKKRDDEFITKSKPENIHLTLKKGMCLAAVIVFVKANKLNKRNGK